MTPQEQKDLLLGVVTKLATKRLEEGGFIPFGATLGSKRDVKLLMPKSMKQNVTRDELEAYWIRELRKATAEDACKTACSCADVRVPVGEGELVPALLIHVEHAEGSAEDILYPYRKDESSGIVLGEPTSAAIKHQIFVPAEDVP